MPLRSLTAPLIAAGFLLLTPLARADPLPDTADLIGILRAIHADRCGFDNWTGHGHPVVISDRPWPWDINEITGRPFVQFGIALMPRAPAGTLWPRVTLCPGLAISRSSGRRMAGESAAGCASGPRSRQEKVTVARSPRSSAESSATTASCASATERTIASPKPLPDCDWSAAR